jgi:hypothetical protein
LSLSDQSDVKQVRTFEELFLELSLCDFDFNRLVNLLVMAALVVGVVLDGRGEEGVDEGGLAKARLAGNLMTVRGRFLGTKNQLTMMVNAAPLFATILCLVSCECESEQKVKNSEPLVWKLARLVNFNLCK